MRNAYRILVRDPEDERPLKRLECKWDDNIKIKYILKKK
jgi:hypothetical protein